MNLRAACVVSNLRSFSEEQGKVSEKQYLHDKGVSAIIVATFEWELANRLA